MPLANDFCEGNEEREGYAPLKLMWCPRCTLGQLSVVVNPKLLYKEYSYVTSNSQTMRNHFDTLIRDLKSESECESVLEIGSNDGRLLNHFQELGTKTVLGIEPASNLADIALRNGINTINEFFDQEIAGIVADNPKPPDVIVARHVFCHIDDWQEAIYGLQKLCANGAIAAIEVPYFIDTINTVEFDQIYHEHLSYMTIEAMKHALQGTGMVISNVKHYPIHGGAIVMFIKRGRVHCDWSESLTLEDLRAFAHKSHACIADLIRLVHELVADGKIVVGYGASAKATQWINSCGFTRKHLKWVCDSTHQKQWAFMPGTDIPVVDEGALTRDLPDYAICFAWNFADEIIAKEKIFREKGGRWIVPHGEIKIVEPHQTAVKETA